MLFAAKIYFAHKIQYLEDGSCKDTIHNLSEIGGSSKFEKPCPFPPYISIRPGGGYFDYFTQGFANHKQIS